MPYMPAGRSTRRYKKVKNNNTKRHWSKTSDEMKKGYRPRIARQIQSADHRFDSQVLKFSKQFSFVMEQREIANSDPTQYYNKNNYIVIEGNNIMNILNAEHGGAHNTASIAPNNPNNASSEYPVQVTSYGDWKARYDNYRVLSSRITATWKQMITSSSPALAYIIRTNDNENFDGIDNDSQSYDIKKMPNIVQNTMMSPPRS